MFNFKLEIDVEGYVKSLQEVMFQRAYIVAKRYQNSVIDSISLQATTPSEHAYPGYPPLKQTGDLASSIHIYGGIQSDGDIYFTVYCVAAYGNQLEETHPFMYPVFDAMKSDAVTFMSQGAGLGGSYMIETSARFTRPFIHQYTTEYPNLPALSNTVLHQKRASV